MPRDRTPSVPRVLVTGVGGPAGLAVMKSLQQTPVELYAAELDPYAAGLYHVPAANRVMLPPGNREDFVEFVLELCIRERIAVLIPTVDVELLPLAAAYEQFASAGVHVATAPAHTLRTCLDKWRLHERCEGVVHLPRTSLVDDGFEPHAPSLPAVAKPRTGSGSRGVRVIEHRAELIELPRDGSLIVQEYLPGLEYSIDVLAGTTGCVIASVPRSRLKVDSGIAVTGRTVRDERLETLAATVAETVGLRGIANVQVKLDRCGVPALLEVNPRVPGSLALTIASGVDMPRLWIGEILGAPVPAMRLPFEEIAMVRHLDERFFDVAELTVLEHEADAIARAGWELAA